MSPTDEFRDPMDPVLEVFCAEPPSDDPWDDRAWPADVTDVDEHWVTLSSGQRSMLETAGHSLPIELLPD